MICRRGLCHAVQGILLGVLIWSLCILMLYPVKQHPHPATTDHVTYIKTP